MEHLEVEPPEVLQDTIKCFWYDSREVGESLSGFEVIPDGYAELIFYFGSLYKPSLDGNLQPLSSPFMMGLLNQPVLFYTRNRLEIIGVRCYPWTVFDLLGLPSDRAGGHLFEHPIAQLQTILQECIQAGTIEEAIARVAEYFLTLRSQVSMDSMLFKAGVSMREANGTLSVSEVAAAVHATVRTLERKFRKSSGYTVKDVSGLMRFEQVRNHLWLHPDANLAGLAYELGYTDQSHLSREFKRYSGTTPAAFARQTKKGKQGLKDDFVAFIQA